MAKTQVRLFSLLNRAYPLYRSHLIFSYKNCQRFFSVSAILLGNVLLAACTLWVSMSTGSLIATLCLEGVTYTAFFVNAIYLIGAICLYTVVSTLNVWNLNWLKNALSKKMNRSQIKKWLKNKNYYHLGAKTSHPEQIFGSANYHFTENIIDLFDNYLLMICHFLVSAVSLYMLSLPLSLTVYGATLTIPGLMLFGTVIFALAYNYIADKYSQPLKKAHFRQQHAETNLIENVTHVKTHAESIAFKKGSKYEKKMLLKKIEKLSFAQFILARTRALMHFIFTFYAQLSPIFAILLYAPNIISQKMGIAKIFESTTHCFHVTRLFTWKREYRDKLSSCNASLKQIENLNKHLLKSKNKSKHLKLNIDKKPRAKDIKIKNLTILEQNGKSILKNCNVKMPKGNIILLQGASGTGKTSFFRAIAGIASNARGCVKGISRKKIFIPSRPYFPFKKTLLAAILYPSNKMPIKQKMLEIKALMKASGLKKQIVNKLYKTKNWYGQDLSDGERKKIELISAILKKPDLLFMDEVFSGIDEASKLKIQMLLRSKLKNKTIIYTDHNVNGNRPFYQYAFPLDQKTYRFNKKMS